LLAEPILLSFDLPLTFMFADYAVNLVGQFELTKIEHVQGGSRSSGTSTSDLLNLLDNWMKNIVWRAASFAYFS
jgi:hypothetical protein